jgi:putative component of membrane protein insertase Oxa1/YidC/SpoIIIJ protein YidD
MHRGEIWPPHSSFRPLDWLCLAAIGFYQRRISPRKGWRCAHAVLHQGTGCSGYVKETIKTHGWRRAIPLARQRFAACQEAGQTLRQQRRLQMAGPGPLGSDSPWDGSQGATPLGAQSEEERRRRRRSQDGRSEGDCCDCADCNIPTCSFGGAHAQHHGASGGGHDCGDIFHCGSGFHCCEAPSCDACDCSPGN